MLLFRSPALKGPALFDLAPDATEPGCYRLEVYAGPAEFCTFVGLTDGDLLALRDTINAALGADARPDHVRTP